MPSLMNIYEYISLISQFIVAKHNNIYNKDMMALTAGRVVSEAWKRLYWGFKLAHSFLTV